VFVVSGFLSWNSETSHVDLEKELEALTSQAPEGEEARNGKAGLSNAAPVIYFPGALIYSDVKQNFKEKYF
jgi:hypothetical protein